MESTIFQVEDDEDFSFLMECAIKEINRNINLTISPNGNMGLRLLQNYREKMVIPGMILLDINLPGISGIHLLKMIREIPFFDPVPVVMFSTSDNPRDAAMAIEFGANEFRTKPMGYCNLVKSLEIMSIKYLKV